MQAFMYQRLGWLSLLCAALAFVLGWRALAWTGWLAGLAGLVWYSFEPAAVGALLALLALAREQRGQAESQADEQPGDGLGVGRLG
ncbi:hypothetical protein E6C76_05415 [Pseudothauera nasutitermitis]|uniref:Uncharacterized protein n=1 Tax=Pseudothauera nasutitermitis TaxID=2565930 RepID=A0A4S4B6Q3_9RHOO|nr:hypothetical protein E6C76_05415 [Pseudothauera nasutitermitis]